MTQWKQREVCPAKAGDKIYWIHGDWGKPELITVTGECDDGPGYTAFSQRWADDHPDTGDPDDPEFSKPGMIHTCNGFICKTKKEARAESLKIARRMRADYAAQQSWASKVVRYLDWVIARGGKH